MGDDEVREDISREWNEKVTAAEQMVPLVGRLHRERGVEVTLHGRSLVGESVTGIVKAHRFARRVDDVEFPVQTSLELLRVLSGLPLGPSVLDLAALSVHPDGASLADRVRSAVAGTQTQAAPGTADVVLYGFGRIGRLLARILLARSTTVSGLRLRAVVVRRGSGDDLVKRASLLRRDSVHGAFEGTITVDTDRDRLVVNGTVVQFLYSDDPAALDYTRHGIRDAVVIDNTGKWRDEAGLSRHLESPGVARVLLTAPGRGSVKNVVHGLNHDTVGPDDRVVSAASCTTNAIGPVLKVLHERFGVEHGHVETVHSFTNDQNLIDNFHKGERRGRSAVLNMVLTETGAARAVAKAVPELAGKLTGNSIRVPTPDVSLAVLNLTLSREVTKAEVNDFLRSVALHSALHRQVDYVESPEVVSTDFVGSRGTGVVDGLATIADGRHVVVYVWYDNEYGYSEQVLRVAGTMAGVELPQVPRTATPAPPLTPERVDVT
ncbi:glyceraldehyde-3-phosphate dehydrogenase [Kineococcus sp. SYSU DK003]|uniref:glyceraldehyde-3-phosphate dehydrogenase n=1 Tax=Kineococcus sp. SYSU DK003 TaxID=3383124 RepID=UPI003D7ED6CE